MWAERVAITECLLGSGENAPKGRHFSFCWYFCWYFSSFRPLYRGEFDSGPAQTTGRTVFTNVRPFCWASKSPFHAPRSTLNSLNRRAGNAVCSCQTMFMGRAPVDSTSVTGPQAMNGDWRLARTNS